MLDYRFTSQNRRANTIDLKSHLGEQLRVPARARGYEMIQLSSDGLEQSFQARIESVEMKRRGVQIRLRIAGSAGDSNVSPGSLDNRLQVREVLPDAA